MTDTAARTSPNGIGGLLKVVTCIPTEHIKYRCLRLPAMQRDAERLVAANWKVASELKCGVADLRSAVYPVGHVDRSGTNTEDVIVASMDASVMDAHAASLRDAGFVATDVVDLASCLIRCFAQPQYTSITASTLFVVSIHWTHSLLLVMNRGRLCLARTVAIGRRDLLNPFTPDVNPNSVDQSPRTSATAAGVNGRNDDNGHASKFLIAPGPILPGKIRELAREIMLCAHHTAEIMAVDQGDDSMVGCVTGCEGLEETIGTELAKATGIKFCSTADLLAPQARSIGEQLGTLDTIDEWLPSIGLALVHAPNADYPPTFGSLALPQADSAPRPSSGRRVVPVATWLLLAIAMIWTALAVAIERKTHDELTSRRREAALREAGQKANEAKEKEYQQMTQQSEVMTQCVEQLPSTTLLALISQIMPAQASIDSLTLEYGPAVMQANSGGPKGASNHRNSAVLFIRAESSDATAVGEMMKAFERHGIHSVHIDESRELRRGADVTHQFKLTVHCRDFMAGSMVAHSEEYQP